MDEDCRAIDAQTADVRLQIVGVADKLNDCVTNRDINLPQSECAGPPLSLLWLCLCLSLPLPLSPAASLTGW